MAVILNGATGGIQLTSASGGTMSVNPPATATSYVSTLPAATGTLLNSASSLPAANLTGTVPTARLGSGTASSSTFLAGDQSYKTISSGGMTLLSTVATTSGTEVVAGSLNLTGYQSLMIYASDVGVTAGASLFRWKETGGTYSTIAYTNTTSSVPVYSVINHNLITGVTGVTPNSYTATNTAANLALAAGTSGCGTNTGIDQATTSITFSTVASQTFNRGQILIYGLK